MDTRYYLVWHNKSLTDEAEDIEDMIAALEQGAQMLRDMQEAGVWLEGAAGGDRAYLVTDDQDVAFEFGFEEEEEKEQEYDEEEYDEEFDSEYEGEEDGDYYGEDDDYEDYSDEDYN